MLGRARRIRPARAAGPVQHVEFVLAGAWLTRFGVAGDGHDTVVRFEFGGELATVTLDASGAARHDRGPLGTVVAVSGPSGAATLAQWAVDPAPATGRLTLHISGHGRAQLGTVEITTADGALLRCGPRR